VTQALQSDHKFLALNPQLLDNLIFLNIRITIPFMLNQSEFTDPVYRTKQKAYELNKSLKELFRQYFTHFKIEDKSYMKIMMHAHNSPTKQETNRHLILLNLSKLIKMRANS
jgi:hypothetical protein